MKKTKLALAIGAGAAVLVSVSALASHSWNNYHWARTNSPFLLKVVDSVTSNWQVQYQTTLDKWDNSGVINFTTAAADDGSRTRKRCAMVAGQMRVCNAAYGTNGWLGLASINLDSGGHIKQGTAKMNDSYSSYWTPEEMNHVMCQEVGHVFGLGHTSEDGSTQNTCMDYSTSSTSQWPNNHDYQQLQTQYGHLDSYDSAAFKAAVAAALKAGGDNQSACVNGSASCGNDIGERMGVKVFGNQRYQMFAHAEANGSITIHHVYLVPGSHRPDHHD